MSTPYLGDIRMFGGNFAPAGYAFCDGQLLSIAENDALFVLLGTTYGGDGQTTFGLPDLRGRLPVHNGQGSGLSNYVLGQSGGTETVTLTTQQIAAHNHPLSCQSGSSSQTGPANAAWGSASTNPYASGAANVTMNANNIGANSPSAQPHDNIMPYLCINFIIALQGVFPSQG